MYRWIVVVVCIAAVPIFAYAQGTASVDQSRTQRANSLLGRHGVSVNLGLLIQANSTHAASGRGFSTDSRAEGAAGGLAYTYWFKQDWATGFSVGVLAAEAKAIADGSGSSSETGSVIPILFGLRWQPSAMALSPTVRPYVSAAVGPYVGVATKSRAGLVTGNESFTDTAVGAYVAVGVDWIFRRLTFGLNAGYHFVSDFDQPIASDNNYSGPQLALSFGLLFGRGATP